MSSNPFIIAYDSHSVESSSTSVTGFSEECVRVGRARFYHHGGDNSSRIDNNSRLLMEQRQIYWRSTMDRSSLNCISPAVIYPDGIPAIHRGVARTSSHEDGDTGDSSDDNNETTVTSEEPPISDNTQVADNELLCSHKLQVIVDRTAELSKVASRALVFDIMPWVLGSLVIFFTFRNAGLGLGVTAFLVMVSAHGVIRWRNAAPIPENLTPHGEIVHPQHESHNHHHHHHHNQSLSSSQGGNSSDELDLTDEEEIDVVKVLELPPPYDLVTNSTNFNFNYDLELHLTPGESRQSTRSTEQDIDPNARKSNNNLSGTRLASFISSTSYLPGDVEDESLPSYSEAVKKFNKKKTKDKRCTDRILHADIRFIFDETTAVEGALEEVRIMIPLSPYNQNPDLPTTFLNFNANQSTSIVNIDDHYEEFCTSVSRLSSIDNHSLVSNVSSLSDASDNNAT